MGMCVNQIVIYLEVVKKNVCNLFKKVETHNGFLLYIYKMFIYLHIT